MWRTSAGAVAGAGAGSMGTGAGAGACSTGAGGAGVDTGGVAGWDSPEVGGAKGVDGEHGKCCNGAESALLSPSDPAGREKHVNRNYGEQETSTESFIL